MLIRILIGIAGVLGLSAALLFWLRPESAAAGVGLAIANGAGTATIRADIAGFFGASGVFALLAAVRNRAHHAFAVLVLMAFALFGRIVNLVFVGWNPVFLPPMAIEVMVIVLFAFACRVLGESQG
jgi:hypothetical protein